jgi:hypothetical protein
LELEPEPELVLALEPVSPRLVPDWEHSSALAWLARVPLLAWVPPLPLASCFALVQR